MQSITLSEMPADNERYLFAKDNDSTLYADLNITPDRYGKYELKWIMESPITGTHTIVEAITNPLILSANNRVIAHWNGFINNQPSDSVLDRLNEAYDTYNLSFQGHFHSALWSICVDKMFAGKIVCFTSNYTEQGHRLGVAVANESGYCPTPAYFSDGIKHDEAQDILDGLNKIVFDLDDKASAEIVLTSFRRR